MAIDDLSDHWTPPFGRYGLLQLRASGSYTVACFEHRTVSLICDDDLADELIRRMLQAGVPIVHDFPDPVEWVSVAQDLRAVGCDVTQVTSLPEACVGRPQAVPVLMRWVVHLAAVAPPSGNRDWLIGHIVRALVASGADITTVMLDLLPRASMWSHGDVLHAIVTGASAEHADRILDAVVDEAFGVSRCELILLLKRIAKRHPGTLGVLTRLVDDDTVAPSAMDVLARLHPREAVDLIAAKLGHSDQRIARAAKINHRIAVDKTTRPRPGHGGPTVRPAG